MVAPAHTPVMTGEVIKALSIKPGGRYIDCTLGAGGHAAAILEHCSPGGKLLGIDADPQAIELARARLGSYSDSILLINDNFVNLEAICYKYDFLPVHGILFDLGLASFQIDIPERGFSFQTSAPLDMRFSPTQKVTAADIVNTYAEAELAWLIKTYGEERLSRQIARRIIEERPIRTTLKLARIIEQVYVTRGKIHPATRTFQALRIAVNEELDNLISALKQAINLLAFEGRLVVISYHSLEDRIVKQFMQREAKNCICPPGTPTCVCGHTARLKLINRKVIIPSLEEIQNNPRSRSAKLRTAERILVGDEQYGTIQKLCLSVGGETGGWRRPILIKRLKEAYLAAV
ncbi:MAG: 16S rRNA (cytosine(1402)-N(4))-methyltransferase RsmH [Chloroflexota bacterium]